MIKKEKRKAISMNPASLLIYGPPKVGKTTMLSKLDDCLIIDTEKGTRMIEGYIQEVNSRQELIKTLKDAIDGHEFKYVAIDTIDKVVAWAEQQVCSDHDVESIADLSFGKGYGLTRDKVMNTITAFK